MIKNIKSFFKVEKNAIHNISWVENIINTFYKRNNNVTGWALFSKSELEVIL